MRYSASTDVTDTFTPPQHLPAWNELKSHANRLADVRVTDLFSEDSARFERLSRSHDDLLLDLSKQRIDDAALNALVALAEQAELGRGIEALFNAETLNFTERRAALHMAMRAGCAAPDTESTELLARTAARMRTFASNLIAGNHRGATGKAIRTVINIGIGGSDLGPRMAAQALGPIDPSASIDVRFVANIDPRELAEALVGADPHSTLFVVSSKSFSTAETLANAQSARAWLCATLGDIDTGLHFAAVSNATAAAAAFSIPQERVFSLPDWVGGRYSAWSAIGLPLLIAIGESAFDEFLAGGRSIDTHFRSAPLAENLPVLMGLTGLWNTDFLGIESLALLPYAHGLRNFAPWLQQLEMESNGKHCLRDGTSSAVHTSPIVWGGVGTVGQHAFHQLFYQGTRSVALDFLVPVGSDQPQSRSLVENALAQSAALMSGRDLAASLAALREKGVSDSDAQTLAPHLVCQGNQPSTTILVPSLTPFSLGQLMALYEHKVFVQGWIWGINSFDQYGVELGKEMARRLSSGKRDGQDPSTNGLMAAAAAMRAGKDA